MKRTTFLIGAGFNQEIIDQEGNKPPLANNFFQLFLRSRDYKENISLISDQVSKIFNFIQKYYKLTKDDLANFPFDLEELFTFIQLKTSEALNEHKNPDEYESLNKLFSYLTRILIEYLIPFNKLTPKIEIYNKIGKKFLDLKPNIITFNYDLILENIIENAAKTNTLLPNSIFDQDGEFTNEYIKYYYYNWNRNLSYGLKFDFSEITFPESNFFVEKERYWNLNDLYNWNILKLHGSINWHYTTDIWIGHPDHEVIDNKDSFMNKTILTNEQINYSHYFKGWLTKPLIITPVLYKTESFKSFPFQELWHLAKTHLSECERLIIIGYSFPPTDFSTKRLFLDSFVDNDLEELIVVNPDMNAVSIAKRITHFSKTVVDCKDLYEFLEIF